MTRSNYYRVLMLAIFAQRLTEPLVSLGATYIHVPKTQRSTSERTSVSNPGVVLFWIYMSCSPEEMTGILGN